MRKEIIKILRDLRKKFSSVKKHECLFGLAIDGAFYGVVLYIDKNNGLLEMDVLLNGITPEDYLKNECRKKCIELRLGVKEI